MSPAGAQLEKLVVVASGMVALARDLEMSLNMLRGRRRHSPLWWARNSVARGSRLLSSRAALLPIPRQDDYGRSLSGEGDSCASNTSQAPVVLHKLFRLCSATSQNQASSGGVVRGDKS